MKNVRAFLLLGKGKAQLGRGLQVTEFFFYAYEFLDFFLTAVCSNHYSLTCKKTHIVGDIIVRCTTAHSALFIITQDSPITYMEGTRCKMVLSVSHPWNSEAAFCWICLALATGPG